MANFDTSNNQEAKIRYLDTGELLVVEWKDVYLQVNQDFICIIMRSLLRYFRSERKKNSFPILDFFCLSFLIIEAFILQTN